MAITATFFDFGGVILSSPFEAFNRFEERNGLPRDFIRTINATNPDTNAWAQFERNSISFDRFCELFEDECLTAGHVVSARELVPVLSGQIRPAMVEAVRRCGERLVTACLTNNWIPDAGPATDERHAHLQDVLGLFHHIVESSKVGVRKPDPRFYEIACELAGVEPAEVVFLDDLGVNLKPAAAMGMTTIKVTDPADALAQLEAVVGFSVG